MNTAQYENRALLKRRYENRAPFGAVSCRCSGPGAWSGFQTNGHASHLRFAARRRLSATLDTIRRFCAALRHCAAPLAAMSSSFKLEDDDELALWLGKKFTIDDLIPSMLTSQL